MTKINTDITKLNLTTSTNPHFSYRQRLKYTIAHRKAYREVEKELLGKNTLRGYLHDFNKIVMYAIGLPTKTVHKIHQALSPHHIKNGKVNSPISTIIDWECARKTKPDKTLSAFEFYKIAYPQGIPKIEENLKKLGLWKE
jgi:hypothetical protein